MSAPRPSPDEGEAIKVIRPSFYPPVATESTTLAKLLGGFSIARFGDGELKCMDAQGYFREPPSEELAAELLTVFRSPHRHCIVGAPTLDPEGPKFAGWLRHAKRFSRLMNGEMIYYSAFITRPDSAPWINCIEFARDMEKLWAGKRIAVLSERGNKIRKVVALSAKKIRLIGCPHREAYSRIDKLERALSRGKPEIILLSCGPTATCLANRLAARGIQAIDIGSAGGYLLRLLSPR
jgi:hypothetical protein